MLAPGFFPLSVGDGVKADVASGSGFTGFIFGDEAFDGIEDDTELLVVFLFEGVNPAGQVAIGVHEPAQLDEGAHNGDVDLDGAGRAEDTGEHGNALLGEGVGAAPPNLPRLGITDCDTSALVSSVVRTKRKSSGKRPWLRRTACLRARVSTP
jgi:hypothetical protein